MGIGATGETGEKARDRIAELAQINDGFFNLTNRDWLQTELASFDDRFKEGGDYADTRVCSFVGDQLGDLAKSLRNYDFQAASNYAPPLSHHNALDSVLALYNRTDKRRDYYPMLASLAELGYSLDDFYLKGVAVSDILPKGELSDTREHSREIAESLLLKVGELAAHSVVVTNDSFLSYSVDIAIGERYPEGSEFALDELTGSMEKVIAETRSRATVSNARIDQERVDEILKAAFGVVNSFMIISDNSKGRASYSDDALLSAKGYLIDAKIARLDVELFRLSKVIKTSVN